MGKEAPIGFIGLGIMGKPMSRNLMKAGHSLIVYDVVGEAVEEIVTDGAQAASSAKEVAEKTKTIITMLPDGPDVENVVLGHDGVIDGVASGSTLIDMSSISPLVSQKLALECAKKGVEVLDAPVSGGEPKAIDGTLAIMVGGKKAVFDEHVSLLNVMGGSVTLTGDVGAGNVTKLANQIIVALNIAAVGEALVLATKAGVDPAVVFEAIKGGLAGSTVLDVKGPMITEGNFAPGFRIKLHEKDLRNTLLTAESLKVPLPLTSLVQQMLVALMNEGKGDLDHSAIATFTENLAGVEARKKK